MGVATGVATVDNWIADSLFAKQPASERQYLRVVVDRTGPTYYICIYGNTVVDEYS